MGSVKLLPTSHKTSSREARLHSWAQRVQSVVIWPHVHGQEAEQKEHRKRIGQDTAYMCTQVPPAFPPPIIPLG